MRGSLILLCVLAVAGCVATPPEKSDRQHAVAKIHTELAASYYERAQLGIALDELRKAMQAEPDYAPAYNVRGLVHMGLREDKEAEEDFLHSLKLDNVSSDAHNNYGWFLCQRGRERESVKQFLAAVKNPLYATPEKAYMNAGLCSKKAGDLQDAEEFLQKALLLQPDMPEARLGMAELQFAQGDYAAAQSSFKRYAESNGGGLNAANLWLAVRIARKTGDKNAESSYALRLHSLFPDAPETRLLEQGQ